MAGKKAYKSGRKNPNAYKNFNTKRFITFLIIFIVAVFALTVEIIDRINGDAWSNAYRNAGLIENLPLSAQSELSVYYLDVEQSNCAIVCNQSQVLMIDTGSPDQTDKIHEAMNALNIKKIDYLLITHQHDDHMGGAVKILDTYEVSNIIMPKLSDINMVTTRDYENLLSKIQEKKVNAVAAKPGYNFSIGEALCSVLTPFEQDENLNNMSAVLKISFGSNSFIFQGDAEKKVENALLKSGTDVSADVILIGHHGSKTSSAKKYIEAVSPKIAIISCSKTNSYGHPHADTLETLKNANADIFITMNEGTLCVKSDGNKITVLNSSEVLKTYE